MFFFFFLRKAHTLMHGDYLERLLETPAEQVPQDQQEYKIYISFSSLSWICSEMMSLSNRNQLRMSRMCVTSLNEFKFGTTKTITSLAH